MSKAFRLGIFIVTALAIFAAGVFRIGDNEMLFRSKYRLNAEFPTVAGLAGGADVRVAGIRKGVVRRIDLPQRVDQKVRVEMDLDSETRKVIRKDSSAMIRVEGLMGEEYVEISVGTNQAGAIRENDTLQGSPPVEISDLIRKAGGILDTADDAMQNVNSAAGNLSSITSKVNNGAGTVGALVNDKKVYENVSQASAAMKEDMEAIKHNFLLSHFFNKRGYEDAAELTRYEIGQLPPNQAVKRFSWGAGQIFDKPDTAKFKDTKALNQAGTFLQSNPFGLAVVAGYSDMKGDSNNEKILTQARAMVVRNYLVENFKMDDTRVKTIGLGKSSDANADGISLLIYPPGTNPPAGVSPAANGSRGTASAAVADTQAGHTH